MNAKYNSQTGLIMKPSMKIVFAIMGYCLCTFAYAQVQDNQATTTATQAEAAHSQSTTLLGSQTNTSHSVPSNAPITAGPKSAQELDDALRYATNPTAVMNALGYGTPYPTDAVVFDGRTVNVVLSLNTEKSLIFPTPVKFYKHQSLGNALSVYGLSNQFKITAHKPFEPVINVVQEIGSNRTYLLRISASAEGGDAEPLEIVHGYAQTAPAQPSIPTQAAQQATIRQSVPLPRYQNNAQLGQSFRYERISKLIQYAAQQHYAPSRLLRKVDKIKRVGLKKTKYPLIAPKIIETKALGSWTDGTSYVTSFEVCNKTKVLQIVDWTMIRYGNILASAFVSDAIAPKTRIELGPSGAPNDRTVMFIATDYPVEETVAQWEAGL